MAKPKPPKPKAAKAPEKKKAYKPPGAGRPTKYDPETFPDQAYKYALLNLTGPEIADLMGISERTFETWKKRYPEFSQSIKNGGAKADAHIASRLFNRAEGYVCKVEQAFKVKIGKDQEKVEVVTLEQEVPPDTKAIALWLNNRQGARWRDKQTVEVEGLGGLVATLQAGRERLNTFRAQAEKDQAEAEAQAQARPKPGLINKKDESQYGD